MTLDELRSLALALPEAEESPHHHLTSFRVRGKIFATAAMDGAFTNLFVDEEDRERMLAIEPDRFEKLWWGKNVVGLRAPLEQAEPALIDELLRIAWRRKAPKGLAG